MTLKRGSEEDSDSIAKIILLFSDLEIFVQCYYPMFCRNTVLSGVYDLNMQGHDMASLLIENSITQCYI